MILMKDCKIDDEFNGVNHKPSHDGDFKIEVEDVSQEILDKISGVQITIGGSDAVLPNF